MSAIFTAFGIDWRLLIIDSVNFGLLLLALWYFLYGPLLRILDERRAKVAQGVYDAQAAADRLREIEQSRGEMLAAAGREADEVLAKSRAGGVAKQREITAAAEATAARMIAEAEAAAHGAKERAIAESKQEVAKLIVLGLERAVVEK